jgi:soluble lytic murein transglycosylase-like protein
MVERWRPMVADAIALNGGDDDDVHRFLRIMQCESGGDPDAKNPNSSASGLMQHLTRFWDDRSTRAGYPGADVFDPEANIYTSAWLALTAAEGGWQHWVCR